MGWRGRGGAGAWPGRLPLLLALGLALPAAAALAQATQDPDDAAAREQRITDEIEELRQRLDLLEGRIEGGAAVDPPEEQVDLSGAEDPYVFADATTHVLASPWYRNIHLSGFGAAGFIDTGNEGARPDGGFLIKESSLFIDALVWEDINFFTEIQVNRLGRDSELFARTGEVHLHLRDVLRRWGGDDLLGIKIGRFDIPFGEEYLWQDAPDNPLISSSAAFPYGFDEGILLHGRFHGLWWIASVTDGSNVRSIDDDPDKSWNLKVHGRPWEPLYLSASLMRNGRSAISAVEFGGSHIEPVGATHSSSAGASASEDVDSGLAELDAKCTLGRFDLALSYGRAFVNDSLGSFDRDITWFSVEPMVHFTDKLYAVARYSEIGTYSSHQGYHFDGKTTAGGNAAFGYDTSRFQRISFGLGWLPIPRLLLKAELGVDRFEVIDASPLDPDHKDRVLVGFELAVSF
ncbi:MAG: hypothetical protein ACE5GW_02240 [Planctomycetota bacterium]